MDRCFVLLAKRLTSTNASSSRLNEYCCVFGHCRARWSCNVTLCTLQNLHVEPRQCIFSQSGGGGSSAPAQCIQGLGGVRCWSGADGRKTAGDGPFTAGFPLTMSLNKHRDVAFIAPATPGTPTARREAVRCWLSRANAPRGAGASWR